MQGIDIIEGFSSPTLSIGVRPNETKTFAVARNLTKAFFLSGTIDGDHDTVSLPAEPDFGLEFKVVSGDTIEINRTHDQNDYWQESCINSEANARLIPSSIKFEGVHTGVRAKAEFDPAKSSPVSACGLIFAPMCSDYTCDYVIKGHFSATEVILAKKAEAK